MVLNLYANEVFILPKQGDEIKDKISDFIQSSKSIIASLYVFAKIHFFLYLEKKLMLRVEHLLTEQIIQMMPYARTAETSKNGVVYKKFDIVGGILLMLQGGIPITIIWYFFGLSYSCIAVPGVVLYFLYLFVWKRLHGYTGDCCGAIFLLTELSFYITFIITHYTYLPN